MDQLHHLHSDDLWYADPDDTANFATWVLEKDGKIVGSMTARKTVEAFMMLDKTNGTPLERWEIAQALIHQASEDIVNIDNDIREVHIGVPAKQRGWAKRLLTLPSMFYDGRFNLLMAVGSRIGG